MLRFSTSFFILTLSYLVSADDNSSNKTITPNNKSNLHWGLGIGHNYTGIGANIVLVDENSAKSASIGCESVSYSSAFGTSTNCGLGIAYVTTEIIKDNGFHGVGTYFHITENNLRHTSEIEAALGAGYNYYINGINSTGWNFGVGIDLLTKNRNNDHSVYFSVGYQF